MIHPLLQGADEPSLVNIVLAGDLSPPAKGRLQIACDAVPVLRFIPSFEGQTLLLRALFRHRGIHPFLRRADWAWIYTDRDGNDSSLPAKGRLQSLQNMTPAVPIHPFLRRADRSRGEVERDKHDSSLLTKGRPYAMSAGRYCPRFIPSYEGQTPRSLTV